MQSTTRTLADLWSQVRQLPLATQLASGILLLLVVALGVLNLPSQNNEQNITKAKSVVANLTTQTVGAETEAFATFASWPGEIISPSDADVQSPRAGTIISWSVSIGEFVQAGSVLGRLSAAPLTPELASTLAEQAAALAQAKARASSTGIFVSQTKSQLSTFSSSDSALQAIKDAEQTVSATEETIKSVLRRSIVKEFAVFSGSSRDILSSTNNLYSTILPYYFGAANSSLRDRYLTAVGNVLAVLDKETIPQKEGAEYFLASTRLAWASVSGGEFFTQTQLDNLRKEIGDDQADFNEAVEKYRDAVLNVSEKEKEYAERTRDTANKFTELDREHVTAQGEVEAAEAAYRAVSGAITGGTAIIAPKSGYVSAIVSQIGEFVEPGKAIASISSGVQTNKIIRFRIPSNAEVPKKGDMVKIIRPGFAKDVRTAIITGVGTALDGNGAFMADARTVGDLEWPAHLQVRVVPEKRVSQTIVVPFDAVFWNTENQPRVWVVEEGGLIHSRSVKTGRTFGDAVEILSGLEMGDTYISLASENITEGMKIEETIKISEEPSTSEGDGHGHAHDE